MNRRAANRFDVEAVASTLGETKGDLIACLVSILIIKGKQYCTVTQLFVKTSEQMINLGNLAVETVVGAEVIVFSFGILVCANRRKLPILTTRKHQESKKQPRRIGYKPTQQGYSFSSKIVRLVAYFTPPRPSENPDFKGILA